MKCWSWSREELELEQLELEELKLELEMDKGFAVGVELGLNLESWRSWSWRSWRWRSWSLRSWIGGAAAGFGSGFWSFQNISNSIRI